MNRVSIRADGLAAGKNNVTHISATLVWGLGAEHPRVSSLEADFRPLEVKECEAKPIDASRGSSPHSVVDHQPAVRRFNRRRAKSDLVRGEGKARAHIALTHHQFSPSTTKCPLLSCPELPSNMVCPMALAPNSHDGDGNPGMGLA